MDLAGHCTCQNVRYKLTAPPLFVHACHCSWCQRETGSAFVVNALIELSSLRHLEGEVESVVTPSDSGNNQRIVRCTECRIALWSHYTYGKIGALVAFVRVGTLAFPELVPPDIHICTDSKLSWVQLSEDALVMPGFYKASEHWPEQSLARRAALYESLPREEQ